MSIFDTNIVDKIRDKHVLTFYIVHIYMDEIDTSDMNATMNSSRFHGDMTPDSRL